MRMHAKYKYKFRMDILMPVRKFTPSGKIAGVGWHGRLARAVAVFCDFGGYS